MSEYIFNGAIYKLPEHLTRWQRSMYIHLINWKWNNITKEPGMYQKKDRNGVVQFYEYDTILPENVRHKFPIIYPTILDDLLQHQRSYKFKFHEHFNHMASSQAANINLFLPILVHQNANKILSSLKPDFNQLAKSELYKGFRIEFWDGNSSKEKGSLGDHSALAGTDSDIAIAYYNRSDELCLWLIEHKLTEKEFTTCGGAESRGRKSMHDCTKSFSSILNNKDLCYYHSSRHYSYWNYTESNKSFFVNHSDHSGCPFRGGMNQLWRNQLLSFSLEQKGKFRHVYFSVVHHPENEALNDSLNQYKYLIDNNPKFTVLTSKDIIKATEEHLDSDLLQWISWYRDLYKV